MYDLDRDAKTFRDRLRDLANYTDQRRGLTNGNEVYLTLESGSDRTWRPASLNATSEPVAALKRSTINYSRYLTSVLLARIHEVD